MDQISLDRCFKPVNFGTVVESTLHHFLDASEYGYGQVSYLRLVDNIGRIHCNLVIGRARFAPLKCMTMPRMELIAATLSVKISVLLKKELQIPIKKEMLWTDSELSLHTLEMKLRGSRFLWLTGLNLSKSTRMNVNGFTSARNRILQIMLQEALAYAIKTKLKNGFLVQSFFGSQKKSGT